jgi:mycothiol synthase
MPWPGFQPEPFDRWAAEQTGNPSYDPTLWLLATEAGAPVGALTANLAGDHGWVDHLAVLAPARGRGVARACCFTRSPCSRAVGVDAEHPTGATKLYERVGMRVVNRWDVWER